MLCRTRTQVPSDWLQEVLYELQPLLPGCSLLELLQACRALVLLQVGGQWADRGTGEGSQGTEHAAVCGSCFFSSAVGGVDAAGVARDVNEQVTMNSRTLLQAPPSGARDLFLSQLLASSLQLLGSGDPARPATEQAGDAASQQQDEGPGADAGSSLQAAQEQAEDAAPQQAAPGASAGSDMPRLLTALLASLARLQVRGESAAAGRA
jgi:hypothetical protein